jgi:hypothetical protein
LFIECKFWIEEIQIKMFAWDNPGEQVLSAVMKTVSMVRDRMPHEVDEGLAMLPKTDTTFSDAKVVAVENPLFCN